MISKLAVSGECVAIASRQVQLQPAPKAERVAKSPTRQRIDAQANVAEACAVSAR